jgi:hypothetical protein
MSLRRIGQNVRQYLGREHRAQRPRVSRRRLEVEALEERTVPTILFNPQQGPETLNDNGRDALSHPPVYLIFWGGTGWGDSPSNTLTNSPGFFGQDIWNAEKNLVENTSYLSGLSHYHGSDGTASLAGWRIDNSPAPDNFSASLLDQVVRNAINNPLHPLPNNLDNAIYLVVTPPGVRSQNPQTGQPDTKATGYHTYDGNFNIGWVSCGLTATSAHNAIVDRATRSATHELVETITDSRPGEGFTVTTPTPWTQPYAPEICDAENEKYSYRVGGTLVEPYLSNDGQNFGYVVYDGTAATFTVVNGDDLLLKGDQFVVDANDDIKVGVSAAGGVTASINSDGATFEPGAIGLVLAQAGASFNGHNTVTVNASPTGVTTYITCSANDILRVGSGNAQGVLGNVDIGASAQATPSLTIDDSLDPGFHGNVRVTSAFVSGLSPGEVDYPGVTLSQLTIDGGGVGPALGSSGGNTFSVTSTPTGLAPGSPGGGPTSAVWVYAGPGNDTVNVGSHASGLGALQMGLILNGQGGSNTLNVDDSAATQNNTYTVGSTLVTRANLSATISFGGMQQVNLTAGQGSDTVALSAPITFFNLGLGGGPGLNRLVGPNAANAWAVNGVSSGGLGSRVLFGGFEILQGGTGNDTFQFTPAGVVQSLDGKGGVNELNYATFGANSPVTVNLGLQTATGCFGSVAGIQNVTGGAGDDLLVGDGNANVLVGGDGRNILIGDAGADALVGGTGDDLLIADTTAWDGNLAALNAIWAEWTRTDLPGTAQQQYDLRFKHLTGQVSGGLNSGDYLTFGVGGTVQSDGAADSLTDNAGGWDWFCYSGTDALIGWVAGEHKNGV